MNGEEQRLVLQRIVYGLVSMTWIKCLYDEILIITTSWLLGSTRYFAETSRSLRDYFENIRILVFRERKDVEGVSFSKILRLLFIVARMRMGGYRAGFGEG